MLITSEPFKTLVLKYFPNFNFKKEMSQEDIFSLKRVVEKKESLSLKQADITKRLAAIKEKGLWPKVEVSVDGKKFTIKSISIDGMLILAGKKGAFSPLYIERV